MTGPGDLERVRERVRARYAQAAVVVADGGVPTCADSSGGAVETGTGADLYSDAEQGEVPELAVAASLGCGNPVAVADLKDGETVLDLGSGAASTCCCPLAGSGQLIDL